VLACLATGTLPPLPAAVLAALAPGRAANGRRRAAAIP